VVYPHDINNPPDKWHLLETLKTSLDLGIVNDLNHWYKQTDKEYVDKDVFIVNVGGFRVDLFFLEFPKPDA
jgi:hypothetical protein